MERTIIDWSFPNWITVVLMAALGYLIFGIASQFVLGALNGGAANDQNGN